MRPLFYVLYSMNHSHYGPDVQKAVDTFRELYSSYANFVGKKQKENTNRSDVVQQAWDDLVKARKIETGIGYYLDKEQFAIKRNEHTC